MELPPAENQGKPAQKALRTQRRPQEEPEPTPSKPFPSHELQNLQQRMSELQMMESSINGYLAQSGGAIDGEIVDQILSQTFEVIEDAYFSADALHLFTTGDDCPDCMKGEGDACPFQAAMDQLDKKMLFYLRMEPVWIKMGDLGDQGADAEPGMMEANHG